MLVAFCLSLLWTTPLHAVDWLPFGPDGGDARRIVVDPTDHNHLYLGTATGWIYESRDAGTKWRRLARINKRDDLVLDSIYVDSADPKHLLAGAFVAGSPDGGLFISHDGGHTWATQPDLKGQAILSLTNSLSEPKTLVLGTLKGVYRSTDNGDHWSQISPPDSTEIHNVESVAIDPADPNVIYAGTWHLPWKTTDGGEHWENIKQGIIDDSDVFSIIIDPKKPKIVYASACSGIYKSEDAGVLFHKIQGIPSTARRTRVLMQDPNDLNIVFAGTTEGLWRSNDAGKTWSRTTGPEVIVNDVEVDPTDSKHVLLATDRGGIVSSDDGGDTFHPSNGGFSARQITSMHRDREHPVTVMVGVVNDKEWGGVFRSRDGGLNWEQKSEGLQGRDVFSLAQAPDGTFIAGTNHGIFRFDHEAETWAKVENTPGSGTAVAAHPIRAFVREPVPVRRGAGATHLGTAVHGGRKGTVAKVAAPKGASRGIARGAAVRRKTTAAAPARRSTPAKHQVAPARKDVPLARQAAQPSGEAPPASNAAAALPTEPAPSIKGFDGSVVGLTTVGNSVLALTSIGLMISDDNAQSFTLAGQEHSEDWRYIGSAQQNVVAAALHSASFSGDGGHTWTPLPLPDGLSQIGAIAVEPSATIWVGGREGVFVSHDGGHAWTTPKNLFVNTVNSIFYDEPASRMIVTNVGYSSIVFLVHLPDLTVTYADTGWNLRFARPIGDHLLAATLFDGVVIQPRMLASPMAANPSTANPAASPH